MFERVARWCVLAIAALAPVVNAVPRAWGSSNALVSSYFDVPKLMVFGVALCAAAVLWAVALSRGESALRSAGPVQWLAAGFLGLGVISAASGVHRPTAFFGDGYQYQGVFVWLGYGVLWFLVVQTVSSRDRVRTAAWVMAAAGTVVAAYDLMQMAFMDVASWPGVEAWMAVRGISTLGNPNHLGGFLVLPLVLAAALGLSERGTRARVLVAGMFALMAAAIVLTQTRGAWIGVAVGLAVLGVAAWRASGRPTGRAAVMAVCVAAASVVAALAIRPALFAEMAQRARDAAAASGSGRVALWREALDVIASRPLLGVGPDSYRLAWYGERSADLVGDAGFGFFATEPHNLVLTLASTFGVVAAALAVAFFASTLWRTRAAVTGQAGDARMIPLAGWWAGTLGLAVYLMAGPLPIALGVTLVFGLGVLGAASARRTGGERTWVRIAAAAVATAVAVLLAVVGVRTFLADVAMTQALRAGGEAVAHTERAVRLAPWSTTARLRVANALGNEAMSLASSGAGDPARSRSLQAVAAFEDAAEFSPGDLDVYWEYVTYLSSASVAGLAAPEDVVAVAERGLAVDRYALGVAMNGAVALESLGRDDDVVRMLSGIWDLDPERPEPGVIYAKALARTGESAEAEKVVDVLEGRFPDEASVSGLRSEVAEQGAR